MSESAARNLAASAGGFSVVSVQRLPVALTAHRLYPAATAASPRGKRFMVYWTLLAASVSTYAGMLLLVAILVGKDTNLVGMVLGASYFFAAVIPALWFLGFAWNYPSRQAGSGEAIVRPPRSLRFFPVAYSLIILSLLALVVGTAAFSVKELFHGEPESGALLQYRLNQIKFVSLLILAALVLKLAEIVVRWPPPWVEFFRSRRAAPETQPASRDRDDPLVLRDRESRYQRWRH